MTEITPNGTKFSYVKLVTDREDRDSVSGRYFPQLVSPIPTNRINILVSSENKISSSSSDFDFYVDLRQESANVRSIQLLKAILPLAPQINDHNNTMNITLDGNTANVVLDNGYYNPNSFVNMLQSKLTTAWNTLIPGATVTVSYNPSNRNITITDTSPGPGPYNWQFNASSYSVYGIHVAYFPLGVSAVTQTSSSLEMIYSRYYSVRSNRICQSQRASSLTSSYQPTDILAVIPIAEYYDANQYSPSASFPGTAKTMDCYDTAPIINTTNKDISLRVIDINISDEYGYNLSTIYSDGSFQYTCSLLFGGNVY